MSIGFPNSPLDGTYIKDDFLSNSGVADTTVGELGWEMTTIANASAVAFVASQNGVLRTTTIGASGDGEAFSLNPDGIVLSGTMQSVRTRVRYPAVTGNVLAANQFRVGLGDSVSVTDPAVGIWVRSTAGVLTLEAASTNGDLSAAVAGVSTLTSGTTMVLGTWHDLAIFCEGTNANGGPDTIKLFVDGYLGATITSFLIGSAETVELGWSHWATAIATLELDMDYIECWLPRN